MVIVQLDPVVQEVWDTARRISCSWEDSYQKSIRLCHDVTSCHVMSCNITSCHVMSPRCSFQPFSVDSVSTVTVGEEERGGRRVHSWMDIRAGRHPHVNTGRANIFPEHQIFSRLGR